MKVQNFFKVDLEKLKKFWLLTLILGIVLIVIGFIALLFPLIAGLEFTMIIGIFFLVFGVINFVRVFTRKGVSSKVLSGILAVVFVILGIMLLSHLLAGEIALTLFMGIVFFVDGFFGIFSAFDLKNVGNSSWGWFLFNAILSLLLGIIIIWQWPWGSLVLPGILFAIILISNGFSFTMLSLSAKGIKDTIEEKKTEAK
ncbi:MAG: hypothetical protein PWQ77_757 [Kosmotogales bacterium]|nr:hypothetical protein [Kosmotogales bacterium]